MKIRTAIAAAAVLAASQTAFAAASFTTVNNTGPEMSQATLLGVIYGGAWARIAGTQSYSNGPLTAFRVADGGLSSPINIATSSPALVHDTLWQGGPATLTLKAKVAADSHTFGFIDDSVTPAAGSGYQPLSATTGLNVPLVTTLPADFRWALHDTTTDQILTSRATDNPTGMDQLITYRIQGHSVASPTWLIAWEDRTSNSDRDFNDAVVEVTAVPAPGSAVLMGIGMMLTYRRRR
jgi:hypothetical protein